MKSCIAKVFGSFFLFLSGLTIADNQAMIETDKQKFSYTIGYQIGNQLAEQVVREKIDIDVDTFMKAIDDAFLNRSPLMTDDEMKESLSVYQLQAMEKDLEIFELKQTMKKLQEMLLEYHDSIQYHCQEMRNLIFDMTKVDAEVLATYKRMSTFIKDVDV